MRRLGFAVALLLVVLVGAGGYVRLCAGGPVGPLPGGPLRGETADGPVADWSFAQSERRIAVESRARWIPYSTTPWFVVHEGRLHLVLSSLLDAGLLERLREDPNLRVRVADRVYAQRAVSIDDPAELDELVRPTLRRLFAMEVEGPLRRVAEPGGPEVRVYRIEEP